jgi:hypothetical protein
MASHPLVRRSLVGGDNSNVCTAMAACTAIGYGECRMFYLAAKVD